jgi:hypothetical protein
MLTSLEAAVSTTLKITNNSAYFSTHESSIYATNLTAF